jgi:hypothetical protein
MSAGHVIVQIRRKQGRFDFIPAYSTDELLRGVCHVTHVPRKEIDRPASHIPEAVREAYAARMKKSRDKFDANREEIYALLAHGRGIQCVARHFRIGVEALNRYLEEEENAG